MSIRQVFRVIRRILVGIIKIFRYRQIDAHTDYIYAHTFPYIRNIRTLRLTLNLDQCQHIYFNVNLDSLSLSSPPDCQDLSNMQADTTRVPTYTVSCEDYVHVVEFSPFSSGTPSSLLAYGGNQYVVVGTCLFQVRASGSSAQLYIGKVCSPSACFVFIFNPFIL